MTLFEFRVDMKAVAEALNALVEVLKERLLQRVTSRTPLKSRVELEVYQIDNQSIWEAEEEVGQASDEDEYWRNYAPRSSDRKA